MGYAGSRFGEGIVFLCGEHEVASELMEIAISSASHLMDIYDAQNNHVDPRGAYLSESVFDIRNKLREDYESDALMLLEVSFLMAGSHACLLPEDRVCGLLGLCRNEDLAGFKFQELLDVNIIYTTFSGYLLTAVDSNNVNWWLWLSLAFTLMRKGNLPSWVPDLHHQAQEHKCQPYRSLLYFSGRLSVVYNASE